MTGLGIYSYNNGDYRAVLYPMDYDGNICGTDFSDKDMTNYSKIVYINNFGGGVCVNECPKVEALVDVRTLLTYNGVFQMDKEKDAILGLDYVDVADYSTAENLKVCDDTNCDTDPTVSWYKLGISMGYGFAYYAVDTVEILGVRCIANPSSLEMLKTQIDTGNDPLDIEAWTITQEFLRNLYGDIFEARYYVLTFGIAAALVIGFLYAQLLRFQPLLGIMIWGSIFCTIGIILGTGGYAYTVAQDWKAADPQVRTDFDIQGTEIFSYCLFGLGSIVLFLTIFLRKQIMLAMACVREASRSIAAMPLMVLFPVVQTLGFLAFMAVWLYYAVHLASTGTITEKELPVDAVVTVREYQFDDFTEKCGWYLIFCFFWTVAFIHAMGQIVIAMSVSKWYFTRDKRGIGSCTVIGSIFDSFRYHLGTAAFGSFIIAVTKIIRIIVAKAQKKARELGNGLGEALLCCCQCCLWCFEKIIKFLNKNAYIQTAIFGTPFCRSAREAFSLIVRNAGKVGSITYVSTVVLFVGKVFISSATTGAAYMYMDNEIGNQLYSLAGPSAIIFLMSYYIGDMFLGVFDMSTATVLHCYVADEEMFDGSECYADGDLREWLDDFSESERRISKGEFS